MHITSWAVWGGGKTCCLVGNRLAGCEALEINTTSLTPAQSLSDTATGIPAFIHAFTYFFSVSISIPVFLSLSLSSSFFFFLLPIQSLNQKIPYTAKGLHRFVYALFMHSCLSASLRLIQRIMQAHIRSYTNTCSGLLEACQKSGPPGGWSDWGLLAEIAGCADVACGGLWFLSDSRFNCNQDIPRRPDFELNPICTEVLIVCISMLRTLKLWRLSAKN